MRFKRLCLLFERSGLFRFILLSVIKPGARNFPAFLYRRQSLGTRGKFLDNIVPLHDPEALIRKIRGLKDKAFREKLKEACVLADEYQSERQYKNMLGELELVCGVRKFQ
jgi:hypothetical protein